MSSSSNLLALGLFIIASTRFAEACSCVPFWGNLCDLIIPVDIVLRATVLERTEGADINDDVIYSLQSVEVFKAENIDEPEYAEGSTFDAAMPGNDGLCGMNLNIGVDYLIDFNREGGEINAVGLCGLSREWSFVDAEDEAILREGCDDYDPCEGSCDEFQECKKGFFSSIGYYCEGPCELTSCADDEECVLAFSSSCDLSESCSPEVSCQQSSAMPSPSPSGFITLTLPPGASIESNTDGAGTPVPGELGDAMTLPPGAVIDSTTDGTSAPSSNELTHFPETLFPVEIIDSTSGTGTPVPGELGDAMTLPPGAVIDSTTDGTSAPSPSEHGDAMTMSPGAVIDSTTGPTGTPTSDELGDAMTLSPGSIVDSISTSKTSFPTSSPTASPTSSPSSEGETDGSNGAYGVGRSRFVWVATCLATMAAASAGFGSDIFGRFFFAT